MSEKETSLVNSVDEQTTQQEESKTFDVNAFLGKEEGEQVDTNTDDQPYTEAKKDEESDDDFDGFSWNEIETESEEQEETKEEVEPEEDWDDVVFNRKKEDTTKTDVDEKTDDTEKSREIDWANVTKALGLNIDTNYKEELEAIVRKMDAQGIDPIESANQNEIIGKMESFLKLTDRDLLSEEMRNDGMEDDDIVSILDSMEDAGTIKRDAFRIRKQIGQYLEQAKLEDKQTAEKTASEKKEAIANNKKQLQDQLKEMKSFMGGRVGKEDMQEAYKYIVSGDMQKDIWNNHGNAAEVAMFMLYKDKFAQILRSQGREEGKAGILNMISSPSRGGKNKSNYRPKSKGFDPNAFMKD
tara:strand:+ start:3121 stop:4185 length:1065 start_codon:yes stop_codon:yes gene_type:complete